MLICFSWDDIFQRAGSIISTDLRTLLFTSMRDKMPDYFDLRPELPKLEGLRAMIKPWGVLNHLTALSMQSTFTSSFDKCMSHV
jgi:hypothetical protein